MIVMEREALNAGCASVKAVKSVLGAGEMAMMMTEKLVIDAAAKVMLLVLVAMDEAMKCVHLASVKERSNVNPVTDMEKLEYTVGTATGREEQWNKFVLAVRLSFIVFLIIRR